MRYCTPGRERGEGGVRNRGADPAGGFRGHVPKVRKCRLARSAKVGFFDVTPMSNSIWRCMNI